MNIHTKKIIAKEIIYFFALVSCLLIIWTIVEMRNSHLLKKQEQIVNEITNKNSRLDSLKEMTLPAERKKQLNDNLTKMFEQGASDDDGRKYRKDFIEKFEEKAVLDEISKLKKTKVNLEKHRQDVYSNLVNNSVADGLTKWCAIILLIILYPLRIIYLTVRWAFRTLKQNSK